MTDKIDVFLKVGPKRNFPITKYVKEWVDTFSSDRYNIFILNDSGHDFNFENVKSINEFSKTPEAVSIKREIEKRGFVIQRWIPAAVVHFYPFFYSRQNSFWSIDADDMLFHNLQFRSKMQTIEKKFEAENIYSYSYDMYYTENTCHYTHKNMPLNHWSFGINISRKDNLIFEKIFNSKKPTQISNSIHNADLIFDVNRENFNIRAFILKDCPLHHGHPGDDNYQIHNANVENKEIIFYKPWFLSGEKILFREAKMENVDIF